MDDLTLAQEADGVVHVRVVGDAQDVVIRDPRLLFGSKVLGQIGDRVAGDGHRCRAPRRAGGRLRIDARGVVDKVGGKARRRDLLLRERARELVDDRPHHLQMPQLLGADVGQQPLELRIRHGIALA